jgi:hypothetical protein
MRGVKFMAAHYKGTLEEALALDAYVQLLRPEVSVVARFLHRDAFDCLTARQFGALQSLYYLGSLRQG